MKKGIAILLLLCAVVMLTGCGRNRKETAFRIVEDNLEVLKNDIKQGDFAMSASIEGIESVDAEKEVGLSVAIGFVEYSCGGAGFGPSTAYWGFYYSEDDDLSEIWCAGTPLVASGDGFLYEQSDGDNRYYTEHIVDHFYYYEAAY